MSFALRTVRETDELGGTIEEVQTSAAYDGLHNGCSFSADGSTCTAEVMTSVNEQIARPGSVLSLAIAC